MNRSTGNRPPGFSSVQQNTGNRGCSLVGPLFQEVRFKVHDPKVSEYGLKNNDAQRLII